MFKQPLQPSLLDLDQQVPCPLLRVRVIPSETVSVIVVKDATVTRLVSLETIKRLVKRGSASTCSDN